MFTLPIQARNIRAGYMLERYGLVVMVNNQSETHTILDTDAGTVVVPKATKFNRIYE